MKKKISLVAIILLLCASTVYAASINGDHNGNPIVKIFNNGKEVAADDTPAMIYENRTMIPIYLLEKLGVTADWNQDNYSVNVVTSKVESQNADYKKQIMASDLYVYLQDSTRYIDNFGGLMDLFYNTENEKGFSPTDYNTLLNFMDDTTKKLNELVEKYNSKRLEVNASDGNEAFKNVNDIKEVYSILQDAFIDMTAWKQDKYESNIQPKVYPQFYTTYSSKVKDSHTKALAIMDVLKTDYDKSVSESLK